MNYESNFFIGICQPGESLELMKNAGIEWVRMDVPFPFEGRVGNLSGNFKKFYEKLSEFGAQGFKVMGITPYPRNWNIDDYSPGTDGFYDIYREACRYLAKELARFVPTWQISNELNLNFFRKPLTEDESVVFLKAGGAGVKEGNPSALIGVNMALGYEESALRMYEKLYPNNTIEFDYVGVDGYYGTWEPGTPETWVEKLDIVYKRTKKPIIIQEFGYPSKGGVMSDDERDACSDFINNIHTVKKWPYGWGGGHTQEAQSEYMQKAFDIFTRNPNVIGAMWFMWADKKCGCGADDCPDMSGYGLMTMDETPKSAYYTFSAIAKSLKNRRV